MDLGGYYAKLKRQRKINTMWYHLYVESKNKFVDKYNKAETDSQT